MDENIELVVLADKEIQGRYGDATQAFLTAELCRRYEEECQSGRKVRIVDSRNLEAILAESP